VSFRTFWLFVATLLLSSPAFARVQRFAVVVGNDVGQGDDARLRYAESDARKVSQVLRDLGGFDAADTVVLLGEDAASARRTLISVNDRIRAAQALPDTQTLLFVYYSGHADSLALRLGTSRFELGELTQLVRGSAATFRLLVVDACRSGVLTRVKGGRPVAGFDLSKNAGLRGEGLAFLTASSANEDAQESDEIRGSFFTHAFVSGLLGAADRDGDGTVVLDEAYRYAYDATLRATSRTFAGTQHPTFAFEMRGQESLALTRPGATAASRATRSFPAGIDFIVLQSGPQGPVAGEVFGGAPARTLSLRPGRYFVRGRGRDVLFEGNVDAAAGKVTPIDTARLDRVQYARLVRKGGQRSRAISHAAELGASARSTLPNADGPCFGAMFAYRATLEAITLAARAGYCSSGYQNAVLDASTDEYAFDAGAEHAWDFAPGTLAVALAAGATLVHQSFTTRGLAPSRTAASPYVAAGGRLSRELSERLFAVLDVRAEWHLVELQRRSASPSALESAFAVRAAIGVGSQF
jgi:hypothetical protein